MARKGQAIFDSRTISFAIGGALLGYFLFRSLNATIIGGIAGLIASFIR